MQSKFFFLYFVPRKPIPSVPKILKKPIRAKIIVADQPPIPLSCIYPGICVPTNVIWKPQTKKPKTNSTYPLWAKASLIAEEKDWSLSACEEFIIVFDGSKKRDDINPKAMKYIKYFNVCSQPTAPRLYCVKSGDKKYPIDAAAVT